MPKSSKKQKDKAADFSKAKLKLGKGKKAPSNAVDTSYKARSIALPTQSIAQPKDSEAPTTRRKLTFDDLTAQLKHYNSGTRKDAILGLRELLDGHPTLIHTHLTALVSNCTRLIADEDASVRRTLLSFLGWLLPQILKQVSHPVGPVHNHYLCRKTFPHSPVLLLFTTSAQTHIFPEIRIDAIRFWISSRAHSRHRDEGWAQSNSSHGRRVLEGYLGVLNAGTTYGEGGEQAQCSDIHCERRTIRFVEAGCSEVTVILLNHALSSPAASNHAGPSSSSCSIPTWFMSSSFTSVEAFEAFDSVLRPTLQSTRGLPPSERWREEADIDLNFESFYGDFRRAFAPINEGCVLQDLSDIDVAASGQSTDSSARISFVAHGPPETELQMVQVVGEICRCLYGAIFREPLNATKAHGTAVEDLSTILGYFSPYFPFAVGGSTLARRDIKVEQAFQDLNLIYCELTSYLVLAAPIIDSKCRRAPAMRAGRKRRASASAQALQLSASAAEDGTVLRVVVEHAMKAGSTSAVKRSTIDFLGRLVLLEREAEYVGACRVGRAAADDQRLEEWLLHLAQTLWELGASSLPTTETILRVFLRVCQRRSPLVRDQVLLALRSRMVPYFIVSHPTRGRLLGPFARLPSAPLRRLVLDVVATIEGQEADGLEGDVSEAVRGTEEESYWAALVSR
ncbi:uncharacterized protein B0H18DRAFT_1112984 [Fomitopsis serialis]|uniref:uncharacterized protein n=1 Tax=Fomitopsis serialis TaxID=139415 RepID=UPI002008A25F|nr:uncharacterized protein B0H18DRAFT_1112984 [Neoantrodia serialis]KAH9937104.1 hypothetical protein B0H18DRAFT_1112984 [Neoantrodia serialis]